MMAQDHSRLISHAGWSLDPNRHLLLVDGKVARIQPGTLKLLMFLVQQEGEIVTKDTLIRHVWDGRDVSDAAIYNRVSALRKAIDDHDGPDRCIHWEYGRGLRFERAPAANRPPVPPRDMDPMPAPQAHVFDGAAPVEEWAQFLGVYHIMYRTPSWPDAIKVAVSVLARDGTQVTVRTAEHGQDTTSGIRQRARYSGTAQFVDGRIYIVEQNARRPRSICLTALDAPHAFQPDIMTGMMMGSSWRLRGAPYTTRVIWRRLPTQMTLRDALRNSGPRTGKMEGIEPAIRDRLGPDCLTFHDPGLEP